YTDLSLETPLHDESEDTMMDMMGSSENIEEIVSEKEESNILSKKIRAFKDTLNDKENYIFDHRIIAEEPITLQEIGEKFQISRERIRQIENKVLKKFKERFAGEVAA
ncbi:MAG: RNA polymerase subunit sigma-70, partial [Syntrophus sp. (in: bacteria)]|nr:RNA polymerase subunit sigma-70 [Syntrophus sp. (in: bacteria)]